MNKKEATDSQNKLYFKLLKSEERYGVACQLLTTRKGCIVERYIANPRSKLEILAFVGLNITPSTKYFGHFPFNLAKELGANVSVIYELGCSVKCSPHFRRFTQYEAEQQFIEGFNIVKGFTGKIIILSHSASTIEHLKLIFDDKYKHFTEGLNIAGGIISSTVTNIAVELRRVWPRYRHINWQLLLKVGKFIDFPLPIYPYYSKSWHAKDSGMNNLSIWINTRCSSFFLRTNIKKIIQNGKNPGYPLLQLLPRHDCLFSPRGQERVEKYMSKKTKVYLVKCDAEHNLFLSYDMVNIMKAIKDYINLI
ncbi:MAG: hypothetical protein HQ579_02570 [Candidatus Omnitrophica bacterium]|nr:hypothetical protein [Candidatus Omnitrophota bacterium]